MSAPEYWLTSERLMLRRMTPLDFDWLCDLYADEDVARYLGGTKTREQTAELMETRVLVYYDQHPGLGVWLTAERATGTPIGVHLVNNMWGESIIQIGYVIVKAAWGRGYATEMGAALMRYAFVDLALPSMAALTTLDNVVSQRVLEKIGLERHGERSFPHPAYAGQGPMAWFERDRDAWLAARS